MSSSTGLHKTPSLLKSNSSDYSLSLKRWFDSAADGLISEIDYIMANYNVSIDIQDHRGNNIVCIAAENNQLELLKHVHSKYKANLHHCNLNGSNALHKAALKQHIEIIQWLLMQGVQIDVTSSKSYTALHKCAFKGLSDVCEHLIQAGANINANTKRLDSALTLAAFNGHTNVVKLLITKKANINHANVDGETALITAAKNGNYRGCRGVVETLINLGAELELTDNSNNTALSHALKRGYSKIVELIRPAMKQKYLGTVIYYFEGSEAEKYKILNSDNSSFPAICSAILEQEKHNASGSDQHFSVGKQKYYYLNGHEYQFYFLDQDNCWLSLNNAEKLNIATDFNPKKISVKIRKLQANLHNNPSLLRSNSSNSSLLNDNNNAQLPMPPIHTDNSTSPDSLPSLHPSLSAQNSLSDTLDHVYVDFPISAAEFPERARTAALTSAAAQIANNNNSNHPHFKRTLSTTNNIPLPSLGLVSPAAATHTNLAQFDNHNEIQLTLQKSLSTHNNNSSSHNNAEYKVLNSSDIDSLQVNPTSNSGNSSLNPVTSYRLASHPSSNSSIGSSSSFSSSSNNLSVISPDSVRIIEPLAQGYTSTTSLGEYNNELVVVKKPHNQSIGPQQWKELTISMQIAPHTNVLRFIGIIAEPNNFCILTQYMAGGSVISAIKSGKLIHLQQILHIAIDCARGLNHLHNVCKVIHRDIAARNVLLDNSLNHAVIADFGLSRRLNVNNTGSNTDSYNYSYEMMSESALPLPWLSPEAISSRQFTPQGDCYSFAIFLYEMLSLGLLPFNTNIPQYDLLIAQGKLKPNLSQLKFDIPNELKLLIEACWQFQPSKRPNITSILDRLIQIQKQLQAKGSSSSNNLKSDVSSHHAEAVAQIAQLQMLAEQHAAAAQASKPFEYTIPAPKLW
jgi:ankyrin repeat protein